MNHCIYTMATIKNECALVTQLFSLNFQFLHFQGVVNATVTPPHATETTTEIIIANVTTTLLVKIVKNVSHFTTIDHGEELLDVPLTPAEVRGVLYR